MSQKKLIKRVLIKPSTMIVVDGRKGLETLRKGLSALFKIDEQDITFTYVEVDKENNK